MVARERLQAQRVHAADHSQSSGKSGRRELHPAPDSPHPP